MADSSNWGHLVAVCLKWEIACMMCISNQMMWRLNKYFWEFQLWSEKCRYQSHREQLASAVIRGNATSIIPEVCVCHRHLAYRLHHGHCAIITCVSPTSSQAPCTMSMFPGIYLSLTDILITNWITGTSTIKTVTICLEKAFSLARVLSEFKSQCCGSIQPGLRFRKAW